MRGYPQIGLKKEVYESHFYKSAESRNQYMLKLFFRNNAYLLKQIKRTLAQQISDIEATGVRLNRKSINKLKYGERVNCSLIYLTFFTEYWKLSLGEMISVDFNERNWNFNQILNQQPNTYSLWRASLNATPLNKKNKNLS